MLTLGANTDLTAECEHYAFLKSKHQIFLISALILSHTEEGMRSFLDINGDQEANAEIDMSS